MTNHITKLLANQLTDSSATVLSLDLGTKTGWAIRSPAESQTANSATASNAYHIQSGTVQFKLCRSERDGVRLKRFAIWLKRMLNSANKISAVYFERVYGHKGPIAAQVYGGFMGALMILCEVRGIPYRGIPVTTIKKFISGKGNATKEEVIQSIEERGHQPRDDNEADALALLYFAMEHTRIPTGA